jgi:hypothetical protein
MGRGGLGRLAVTFADASKDSASAIPLSVAATPSAPRVTPIAPKWPPITGEPCAWHRMMKFAVAASRSKGSRSGLTGLICT